MASVKSRKLSRYTCLRLHTSEMQCYVDWWTATNISEEPIVYTTFYLEVWGSKCLRVCLSITLHLTTNKKTLMLTLTVVKYPVSMYVGPCHHGMARSQVADGGTASYMEGGCE
jgi:hypothetical protein